MAHMAGLDMDVVRYAPGDYYHPDRKHDVATTMARAELLRVFNLTSSRALRELEHEVLPKYVELCATIGRKPTEFTDASQLLWDLKEAGTPFDPGPPPPPNARMTAYIARPDVQEQIANGTLVFVKDPDPGEALNPEFIPLKEALFGWCDRYRFDQEWMQEAVLNDFPYFLRDQERDSESRLGFPIGYWWGSSPVYGVPDLQEANHFVFEIAKGYHPVTETFEAFEIRLQKELGKFLDGYRKRVCQHMEQIGYKKAPIKRKARLHMRWLSQRYFRGWSWDRIASRSGVTVQTVRDAVLKTAVLVKLDLPEGRRGRPANPRAG